MCEDNQDLAGSAQAVAAYLNENNRLENYEYDWVVGAAARDNLRNLAPGFNWGQYDNEPKQGNKDLKAHLSQLWGTANPNQKTELANWVIRDWGGIRGNAPGTIQAHIALTDNINRQTPLEGIASYSKLLAVKNPDDFAIYDARVAAALNAIQILCHPGGHNFQPKFFPYVASRNRMIKRFIRIAKGDVLPQVCNFLLIENADCYQTYLDLLQEISMHLTSQYGDQNVGIVDIEMYLFSDAECLCRKALEILGAQN